MYLHSAGRRGKIVLFQFHNRHAGFALSVAAEPKALHEFMPPQALCDRLPQRAGALAVDDGDALQLRHRSAVEGIVLEDEWTTDESNVCESLF